MEIYTGECGMFWNRQWRITATCFGIPVLCCSIVRKDKQGGYGVGGNIYIVSEMKNGILCWSEPNGFPLFFISMLERRLGC